MSFKNKKKFRNALIVGSIVIDVVMFALSRGGSSGLKTLGLVGRTVGRTSRLV